LKTNEGNVNTDTVQESSKDGSNLLHENYLKLKEIASGILDNRYSYMKLHAPGFMDLVIEKIWNNRISMSHYYEQNGDLMADPDVEIIVDSENEILRPVTFQQDNLGVYQYAYQGDTLVDENLANELNGFLSQWLDNIKLQGHIPYKAHYSEDVMGDCYEVTFDEVGNEIEPNIDEDDEIDM
jgi:hypothetical protein